MKFKKNILVYLILIAWIFGSYFKLWNSFIIPSPNKVLSTFLILLKEGEFLNHISISIIRIFSGFFISFLIAFPLAIIFGTFTNIFEYFKKIFEFMRHTPPLALIPMIILWFGIGEISKIMIIILASFFPIFLNTMSGIKSCDEKLIEVGKIFKLSKMEIFKKIIFPNALPDILTGIKLGIGYSWRAIIGAEMIASSSGIGYLILEGQILSRSDIIFVGILSIGILGSVTDLIVSKIIDRIFEKRQSV